MATTHRFIFLLSVTCIFALGLVMIFNTTSAEVLDHALNKSTHQALFKQLLYACVGMGLAGLVWKVGYHTLLRWSPYLLGCLTILLILTLIPGIGKEANGSRRWLSILGFSFQPSELVKYYIPAYLIYCLSQKEGSSLDLKDFLKLIGVVSVPLLLILIEPNNGTAAVIGLSIVIMCLLAHIRFLYWVLPLMILTGIGAFSAYHLPYVSARLNVYLHPELDLKGKGHQPYQAKIAAGSGQFWGRGPGNSLQKLSYLPEAQNDYIAAIYAEEFGFIGMIGLIFLYMVIGYVGFSVSYTARDKEGFYLAACITFLICFQAFMNLGVVSGFLPSTGLNLPFFSQGGTSLMANLMGVGLLMKVGYKDE
jgi:cell division protein FtsW